MEAQTPTSVRRRCDIVAATRQLQVLCPHGQLLSDCTKCSASAAEASAAEASAAEASPASPSLNVKIPACNDPPLLPELEKGLERSCKICKGPRGQCHRRGTFRHLPRIGSQDWLRSLQYSAKDSSSGQTTRGTCRKCKGRRGECRSPGTPGHLRRGAGTARPLSSSKTPTKRKQPAPPRKCEHGKWFGECSKCRVLLSRSQQRKLRRRCAHGRESSKCSKCKACQKEADTDGVEICEHNREKDACAECVALGLAPPPGRTAGTRLCTCGVCLTRPWGVTLGEVG